MLAPESQSAKEHRRSPAILIVRVSAIGDVLMASPVAQAVREAYPNAYIAWAVEPLSAPLVRANPYVDEVIVVETSRRWLQLLRQKKFLTLIREVRAFAGQLRARKFDITIDIQGLLKTGVICGLTHAPRRIGPSPPEEGNGFFMTELNPWGKNMSHLADGYLAILASLAIDHKPRRPILAIPDDEREAAKQMLIDQGLDTERYVACCPFSSRPQKDWVFSRWGELADLLRQRDGLRTVFIGGPEHQDTMADFCRQYTSHPISAVGLTSLIQSAAIIQDAAGVIGVDTGLTYAGMAVDTPTIALYGSTSADWLREEPHTRVIAHAMPCAPCGRHPVCQGYDCMRAITVEEVADALRRTIAEQATMA